MSLFSLIRRLTFFTIAVALPFAAVGAALGRVHGLVVAEGLLLCLLLAASLRAESGILRIYRARQEPPDGVQLSLDRVLAALGGNAPRVRGFR